MEFTELCGICGFDETNLSCSTCPRSFHMSCMNSSSVGSSDWRCIDCILDRHTFSLSSIDLTSPQPYEYITQFYNSPSGATSIEQIGTSRKAKHVSFTLATVLFYFESVSSSAKIQAMARLVTAYISTFQSAGETIVQILKQQVTPGSQGVLPQSLNLHLFLEQLKKIVGNVDFDEGITFITSGGYLLAHGLKPSLSYFHLNCPNCVQKRYFRTFCCACGVLFDISIEMNTQLFNTRQLQPKHIISNTTTSNSTIQLSSESKVVPITKALTKQTNKVDLNLLEEATALIYPLGNRSHFISRIESLLSCTVATDTNAPPGEERSTLKVKSKSIQKFMIEKSTDLSRKCDEAALRGAQRTKKSNKTLTKNIS